VARLTVEAKTYLLTKWFIRVHEGCSTGLCLTIQIEEKLFDNLKSWDV